VRKSHSDGMIIYKYLGKLPDGFWFGTIYYRLATDKSELLQVGVERWWWDNDNNIIIRHYYVIKIIMIKCNV